MPFETPDLKNIHSTMLQDIVNQNATANIAIDSDFYLRAMATASAIDGLYTHQKWIVKQIFPDTADPDFLEMHARIRGLTLKDASHAYGLIRLIGTPGAQLEPGIQLVRADGIEYYTTDASLISPDGWVDVYARAVIAGAIPNDVGSVLVVKKGSADIISAQVLEMVGGVDKETHEELLTRLLEVIRRPAAGGNKYDYKRWALEVPGVTQAYVFPLRRGLGTVDIIILSAGKEPSLETINNVKKYIDEVRPVTAKDISVSAPVIKKIDLSIVLTVDLATQEKIKLSLLDYFMTLEPGDTLIKSKLDYAISKIDGVNDHQLLTPASNLTFDDIELALLGEVKFYES